MRSMKLLEEAGGFVIALGSAAVAGFVGAVLLLLLLSVVVVAVVVVAVVVLVLALALELALFALARCNLSRGLYCPYSAWTNARTFLRASSNSFSLGPSHPPAGGSEMSSWIDRSMFSSSVENLILRTPRPVSEVSEQSSRTDQILFRSISIIYYCSYRMRAKASEVSLG